MTGPGMLLVFAGMLILDSSRGVPLFLFNAVLYGAGMGICMSLLEAMAFGAVPTERRGSATAVFLIGFDGGIGIGSVAGFLASSIGYGTMYRIIAFSVVLAAVCFFGGPQRKQRMSS